MATFTDLPPEMRNTIYNMLLTGSAPELGVLATSRLVHEEAASYYYQNNALIIDLPCTETTSDTLLPSIPDQYLRYIRCLTINVCLSTSMVPQADFTKRIEALANTCSSLTSLTINLTSNISRLLSARLDDSVLSKSHPLTIAVRHLLSSSTVQSVRIHLDGVWFASHIASQLTSEYGCRLEILTSEESRERALLGQRARTYVQNLGLGLTEAENTQILPLAAPSTPASLSSALSELDHFSPTDFLDEEAEEESEDEMGQKIDSFFDESALDMQSETGGDEEELTDADDVDDDEMEDIDDFNAILGNLGEAAQRAASEADVCYMTNFAPEMLGRWVEGLR